MSKIEEYRGLFMTGSLILILVAAAPILGLFIQIPDGSEKFSELWLLGPTRRAEGYPFNVQVNESHRIYVGVANHLGYSVYYRIYVKLRNQTQRLPEASNSSPSTLPPLYEFDMFVRDDQIWEKPLNFTVLDVSNYNNSKLLRRMKINGLVFHTNTFSERDTERNGYYYQLFFELWLYNMTLTRFQYHNRYVGIWLNITD